MDKDCPKCNKEAKEDVMESEDFNYTKYFCAPCKLKWMKLTHKQKYQRPK